MYIFLAFIFSVIQTSSSFTIPSSFVFTDKVSVKSLFSINDTTHRNTYTSKNQTNNKKETNKTKSKAHNGEKSANRRAIWGFIFGCASILIFPLFCIPGLILSNDALWEERMHPGILTRRNKTFAYLGKIFSYVGIAIIVIALIYFAFIIAFLSALGG